MREIKSGVKFARASVSAVYWSETETLAKLGVRPLKTETVKSYWVVLSI